MPLPKRLWKGSPRLGIALRQSAMRSSNWHLTRVHGQVRGMVTARYCWLSGVMPGKTGTTGTIGATGSIGEIGGTSSNSPAGRTSSTKYLVGQFLPGNKETGVCRAVACSTHRPFTGDRCLMTLSALDQISRPYLDLLILQPTPFCNINCDYCYLPN